MGKPALRLEHLTKQFGKFKAVDDVSFEVQQGEAFSLLGPSGCGKTTTLRLIAGMETPDNGDIYFGDRPIVSVSSGVFVPTHKRNLGMVFQSYAIWPHMTVFDNVAYPLKVRRAGRKVTRDRVMQALELVGLHGLEERQAPQLSGGQQQRVALARALVYEPSILLLDEPFSNLDAKLRKEMRIQLKLLLNRLKITAVFVTHDQIEALSLSDRIAVMHAGHIEQVASPVEVYQQPGSPFTRDFLGNTILLPGKLDDDGRSGGLSVRLTGVPGFALPVSPANQANLRSGSDIFLAIRPEDIHLQKWNEGTAAADSLQGKIESLLFVGDRYECCVRLSNDELISLNAPRSMGLRQDEVVSLKLAEEGVSIWPQ